MALKNRWTVMAMLFCLLSLCAVTWAQVEKDQKTVRPGLAAHYYRDPACWNGMWPEYLSRPLAPAEDWTFSNYRYTRVEPLVNHQFVRRGWFSVRWQGCLNTSPAGGADREASYTFSVWADDGCRLFIDDQKVIDDWRACAEDDPAGVRKAAVTLQPGMHRIVIEYFQGQSLMKRDRDPVKLYWECKERNIPRQILPAAHLSHSDADLGAVPGRLDRP